MPKTQRQGLGASITDAILLVANKPPLVEALETTVGRVRNGGNADIPVFVV